jgi:hypothetical protein
VTGSGKEESSFFVKKEAKKLYPFTAGSPHHTAPGGKRFFASFFTKKEDPCFLPTKDSPWPR